MMSLPILSCEIIFGESDRNSGDVAVGERGDDRSGSIRNRIEIISPCHLPNNLAVEKIRLGNSIIRNPVLVSYAAKGMLPYRGLGSGIKRALEAWPEIDFVDDRDGCLFTAAVHRKKIDSSGEKLEKVGEKLSQNQRSIIEEIIHNPYVSARELSEIVGISSRKIEENIKKLKALGAVRRIGPAKGGHWKVL